MSNFRKVLSTKVSETFFQWIVGQRPLSAPTIPRFDWIVCPGFPRPTMRTALNTDPFNGKQGTCDTRSKPFTFVPGLMGRKTNTAFSMDSSLEAFSGNPTDGSFTALVFQPAVLTKYLNELFLSY